MVVKDIVAGIDLITIANDFLEVKILNRGATVVSFKYLETQQNMIAAYETYQDYLTDSAYLGACVGPLAGRTKDGLFEMENDIIELSINNGTNHLHGGFKGLNTTILDYETSPDKVVFTKNVDHSADGYLGTIEYTITYELQANNLMLSFKAVPSQPSPINLTNHMYFNLGGDLENHQLIIEANKIMVVDETGANEDELLINDTIFDLNKFTNIGSLLKRNHPQFQNTRHIDHDYILSGDKGIALINDTLMLEIKTSFPSVQVYLANYFDETMILEGGKRAKRHEAVALEPQYIPNEVNLSTAKIYDSSHAFEEWICYTITEI